eukprot:GHVU01214735.1.p1 GENE.GHVU01214735.1~~GHVU01214735.1.p1  ORF type:complete len:205 (+),score=18.84 GHVU01214735.1:207-821(+)
MMSEFVQNQELNSMQVSLDTLNAIENDTFPHSVDNVPATARDNNDIRQLQQDVDSLSNDAMASVVAASRNIMDCNNIKQTQLISSEFESKSSRTKSSIQSLQNDEAYANLCFQRSRLGLCGSIMFAFGTCLVLGQKFEPSLLFMTCAVTLSTIPSVLLVKEMRKHGKKLVNLQNKKLLYMEIYKRVISDARMYRKGLQQIHSSM